MRLPPDAGHGAPLDLVVQGHAIVREDIATLAALTGTDDVMPLTAAANEAYRFADIRHHAGIDVACAAGGYDCALVPQSRRLDRVRLIALDMDSTLIAIECIDEIADMLGIGREVARITAAAMRGEIEFRESLTQRVALLAGLPAEALQRVYDERLALSPGAETLLDALRAAGVKSVLVSSGFTFFTERLAARLGLDYTLGNELEVAGGRLTGRIAGEIVDAVAKARRFERLAAELRGFDGLAVAIGDGANDLEMLAAADVSIAYCAHPVVRAQATHAIDHCGLDAVLNLFA